MYIHRNIIKVKDHSADRQTLSIDHQCKGRAVKTMQHFVSQPEQWATSLAGTDKRGSTVMMVIMRTLQQTRPNGHRQTKQKWK